MRIVYHPKVVGYLNALIDVLYEQEYFSFKESAYNYVDWILDRIAGEITITPAKPAPEYFSKYGENLVYISLRRNAQTSWYVFFYRNEDVFYIHYISNNHVIAQYL